MSPAHTVEVDIRADLQNEDETGFVWTYLDRAVRPERVTPGAIVIAGDSGGRCLARVIDIAEAPSGSIVHLDLLPGSVAKFAKARTAA